jgi:hypothetical protein
MNLVTPRSEGTNEALQAVRNILGLVPASMWAQGEPKRRGGFFSSSGLSATIADAKTLSAMVVAIREFVAECKARSIVFSGSGLSAQLSVGVTVGDAEQFVAGVDFSASDLLSLGALGVALSIAAYPTSDEANEINQDA